MNALTLRNHQGLAVDINPEAEKRKSDLCEKAVEIVTIDDDFTMEMAVGCLRSLKWFLDEIEDSRKEIKAPVLTIGKTIDTKAKEFSDSLATEQVRINKLVTAYNNEKTRQNAIAEANRLAELKRIEEERIAAEKAAALERQRLEELAKAPDAAPWDQHAAGEGLELLASMEKRDTEKRDIERKALLSVSHAAPKPEGLSMRNVPRFEVTDIHALYKARPDLVHLEPLTGKINMEIVRGMPECPGLRIWMEQVASVRGAK